MNLAHLLARSARVFPGRPAVASGERVLADYGTLGRRCAAMASALRTTLGLAPGDRVGLLMANSPEYVEMLWAAWWAGLAVVPVNAKLHPQGGRVHPRPLGRPRVLRDTGPRRHRSPAARARSS